MLKQEKLQKKLFAESGKLMHEKLSKIADKKYGSDDRFKTKFIELGCKM